MEFEERKRRNLPRMSDLKVEDNTKLVAKVLAYTKAQQNDPEIWKIFQRITDKLEFSDGEIDKYDSFQRKYFEELGIKPPNDASVSTTVLRQVAARNWSSVDCDEALNFLRKNCKFDRPRWEDGE